MDSEIEKLPASALRPIIIQEIRKFIKALGNGLALSELQEMSNYIKVLMKIVAVKEKIENKMLNRNSPPHVKLKSIKIDGEDLSDINNQH